MFASEKFENLHPEDYGHSHPQAEVATQTIEASQAVQATINSQGEQIVTEVPDPTERIVLNQDMIAEHLGNPENVRWVRAEDLLTEVAESCVDGREKTGVVSTPGGNAGEFVLMVQAAENMLGTTFSDNEITQFFTKYLEKFGKFYMHTDDHALHHIHEAIKDDARFAESHDLEALIRNCPPDLQPALLDHLSNPDHMGCGHLKLMIKAAAEYGVRGEIVQAMVRAYFTELWAGNDNIDLVVLPGDHLEGAVVNITVGDGPFTDESLVPTIAPLANGTSFFTNHPQATAYLRDQVSARITGEGLLPGLDASRQEAYRAEIERIGTHGLVTTVGKLARDNDGQPLPIFEVNFSSQTEFAVKTVA